MNGSSRRLTRLQEESFKLQMSTQVEDRPFINQSVSKMRDSYSTSFGSKVSQYSNQIEERFMDPKILSSSTFAVEPHEDKNYSGTTSSQLTQKKFQLPPQNLSQSQGEHVQFYRSISSNLGTNLMRQSYYKEGADPSMSKTFTESNSLPPQKRVFKIKAFKPIPSGQALESNLSLGETLKQNREIKERIDKERAEAAINKMMQTPEGPAMRIRPATPSLNLLKMKKQRQLGLPLQPMNQINGEVGGHPALRRRKKLPHRLGQLQPLEKLPQLPALPSLMQSSASFNLRKQKILEEAKSIAIPVDFEVKPEFQSKLEDQDLFDRDDTGNEQLSKLFAQQIVSDDPDSEGDYYDEEVDDQPGTVGLLSNFQQKFEEIIENDEVEDAIELNEKFLAEHLGVKSEELSRLTKIELRVDTSCHNLQVTGEILSSLESLRMNDSIIRCFRDIGTSFRFVRILHLARCELIEVQGIQAFINLEELYINYNHIDELFDVGFLEHLRILDFEGNNVKAIEQLQYLKRCRHLTDVNLKYNPVSFDPHYHDKLVQSVPNLTQLDDEQFIPDISTAQIAQQQNSQPSISDVAKQSPLLSRLFNLCSLSEKTLPPQLATLIKQDLSRLHEDDSDLSLMVSNIKSYPIEKKAQRQLFEHLIVIGQEEEDLAQYVKKMTPQKDRTRHGSALKNSTTTGFGSRKKSVNAGAGNDENDGRASNKSDEVARSPEKSQMSASTGGKKVLRIKRSKIKPSNVLEDSLQDPKVQFYGSRSSLRPPSVLEDDTYSGLQALNQHSHLSRDSLKHTTSTKSVIMASEPLQGTDSFALQGEQIQSGGVLKLNVRGSFGSANSYMALSKGGPIKAERIVLRAQDIQFIKRK